MAELCTLTKDDLPELIEILMLHDTYMHNSISRNEYFKHYNITPEVYFSSYLEGKPTQCM